MDASHFDRVAKTLAAAGSRRALLGALVGMLPFGAGVGRGGAAADHGCLHPGSRCDPAKPGRCCSKRCSATTKTCRCTKVAQCPKPANPCKKATCKGGRCGATNRTSGVPCGAGKTCRLGLCLPPPVTLGVFQPGVPGSQAAWDRLHTNLQRLPKLVMWYQHWGLSDTAQLDLARIREVVAKGATPMITWEPWDPREGLSQLPTYHLQNLCALPGETATTAQEENNRYIDAWAEGLAAYGQPVLLRFAHEMNGSWYPWAARAPGNNAGDYVAAWRCVRARFAAKGAREVAWVWSPNVRFFGSAPLAPLYPGDNGVEWVALDGYNWGGSPDDWRTFVQVFNASLDELKTIAGGKPVMIAETASAEAGGDKAAWIRQAMLTDLPQRYPQVRAFVWFNEAKERDWRFNSSVEARTAFRDVAAHPYFRGTL